METTDEQLLVAAAYVLMTEGPGAFTLAKAAARAGVSAATLIKRFGSKAAIFTRLSERWVERLPAELAAAAKPHHAPLTRLRAVALHGYHDLDHPEYAAMQLAALAVDLQDTHLRDLLHQGWGHVREHVARHAADAVATGELASTAPPPERLARVVTAAMEGGCLAWSVHPEGSLVDRLAADLDMLLDPWTTDRPNCPEPQPEASLG